MSYVATTSFALKAPAGLSGCGKVFPRETWIASAPAASSHFATCTESAIVLPFFAHGMRALPSSVALIFTWRWKSSPTSRRIASTVSISSRAGSRAILRTRRRAR